MIKMIVCGACGRMGRRIIACAAEDGEITLAGAIEREGHPCLGRDAGEVAGAGRLGVPVTADLTAAASAGDVVVDFSQHEASARNAATASALKKPVVIGTTGLGGREMQAIENASRTVACLVAPNMSLGVNLLFRIAAEVARSLGEEYDVEIVEVHHRFKKDAPSGTAKRLAAAVADALGKDLGELACHGRSGETGERPRGQIGIHAVRQGDVVGEHTVSFASLGERLELVHRAHSRDAFARGALRAAKWIVGKPPGLYDMANVLFDAKWK
ncbi:MAG: 4-hydroxy-tetrahydrodipicolinate reductase [Candidatus Aureabacteria bacterium]|nr:4-hydroxy-tetrahydrodipicolinate reductase [Candidatus Auribacterota bacterium]